MEQSEGPFDGRIAIPRKRPGWVAPLSLSLLALFTFSSGLSGGFVLDDKFAVLGHRVVQGFAPPLDAFSLNFWGGTLDQTPVSYRPLTTLSYVVDQRLLGGSPVAFHISSLIWYVGLVLAGWRLASRCLPPRAAWAAMALFVVMPVHVENVSSVTGRADVLGLLFGLVACLSVSPTILEGQPTAARGLVVGGTAFAAALLCKESVAALPLVIAVLAESKRRRHPGPSLVKAHLASLIMAAVLGIYVIFRFSIQPGVLSHREPDDVVVGATLLEKLGYGLDLLWSYTQLAAAPINLCSGRRFAEVYRPSHVSLTIVAGVAVLAAATHATWRDFKKRRHPFVLAGLLSWFLITGLIFAMPESMADRFLLQPSFFLCLAAGPLLITAWENGRPWRAILMLGFTAEVFLSARQARIWHDEGTLFSHAVKTCPDSLHNHFRFAEYLSQQGQTAEAVWHYGVVTAGKHAFPYQWHHPATDAEKTLSPDVRVREMHHLLGFRVDEATWRTRFENYLRSFGKASEADLVETIGR